MSEPKRRGGRRYYAGVQDLELRVRYAETDRMGVVYYAHYFTWFEAGRAHYLRRVGYSVLEAERERNLVFPVVTAAAKYHSSVTYDDLVTISTRLCWLSAVRAHFEYEVRAVDDGRLVATGETTHATVDTSGRVKPTDGVLRSRMEESGLPEG